MNFQTIGGHRLARSGGVTIGVFFLLAVTGYLLRGASALGIPKLDALVYSGIVTDAKGLPLSGSQTIGVAVWDADSGGNKVCERSSAPTPVETDGRFSVVMDDCIKAVHVSPNLWVEVSVSGSPLGRSKIGAVPYAVEAESALSLSGRTAEEFTYNAGPGLVLTSNTFSPDTAYLQRRAAGMSTTCSGANQSIKTIGPDGAVTCEADDNATYTSATGLVPAGMIAVFATACPAGWVVCNGANGTPNLIDTYIKGGTAFSPATGSNEPHTHDAGSYIAAITWGEGQIWAHLKSKVSWLSNQRTNPGIPGSAPANDTERTEAPVVLGTSAAAPSQPRNATIVFCQKT
ncbi:MAG: hypothetical protein ACOY0T_37595 [Myxococcota bacterium]